MTGDEVEFRPLPLVGEMAETSASAVTAAVSVRQKGVYNSFTVEPEAAGQEFVVGALRKRDPFLQMAISFLGLCNASWSPSSAWDFYRIKAYSGDEDFKSGPKLFS